MPGNSGVYAGKTRKKPVHKSVKPPPVKTNPSKRHRDRLNGELERLTGMLPFSEQVRGRLDKLSVLRLSVGYLKVKSYFNAALQKHVSSAPLVSANGGNGQSVSLDGVGFSEGDLLLQALNGFVLVVTTDGTIFYTSPTIQDFLGFHQSDVIHQNLLDLVHTEDREMFRCQLHFALKPSDSHARAQDGPSSSRAPSGSVGSWPQYVPPENSSFLDRSFRCRLRCLRDNTSGFLALNFNGRLKSLHSQGSTSPPQLALFAIAAPLQPPSVMAIRTKTLIFQSKHRMDFAPVGIDTRGKLVLGYTEIELVTTGSGYQFIHAADMMYCADNHLRMMKTGDSGFTFFRLLTKAGRWLWVQANARIVFKGGRPDFIIARQKALTNEEGEEHLHQRRQQLPFNLATGEGVLYDVSLESIPGPPGPPGPPSSGAPGTEVPLDPASLLGSLRRQDHSVYTQPQEPSAQLPIFIQLEDPDLEQPPSALERAFLDSHALLSVPGQTGGPRSITGDLTSESMIDSLEQILGDIVDGGLEGLGVQETELRDWEDTLARLSEEREDASREVHHILANDVFSYVEEALRRETAQGPHHVPGPRPPGSTEQAPCGDLLGAVGSSTAHTRCRNAPQGHTFSPWPPGSSSISQHHGNQPTSTQPTSTQPTSTQPRHAAGTQHLWLQNTNSINSSGHRQTHTGPSVWQQFHPPTLTHASHTPSHTASHTHIASHTASHTPSHTHIASHTPSHRASCMYDQREGHGPLLGPSWSRGTTSVPSGRPRPGTAVGDVTPGMMQSAVAEVGAAAAGGCTDVSFLSFGAARSDFPPGSGSIQSSFFCWSDEAQIPVVSLNGVGDPFVFSGLPTGSLNLPQNSGP